MMSDWSKTRSLTSEDVGPNHMMSCPGGFSSDRDPPLDILLDPGYSDLGCAPNLGSYDSGFFPELMEDSDFTTSTRDIGAAALEQLNLGASSLPFSDDQSSNNIGHGPPETLIFEHTLYQTQSCPNVDQIDSSQYCITQPHTYFVGCPKPTNSEELGSFPVQPNVETMAFEESWPKLNKISCLPAEKSNYQQSTMYSFNSIPDTKPLSRKWTPRKRRSPFTGSSTSFKTQKIGITSSQTKRSSCNASSCSNRPDKGKGIARVVDPQEAVVFLFEQSIPQLSEFSQRKATALLSQLKQLYDDERKYGKPQDDISNTGLTSTDSISQDCLSDSEIVDLDGISENTSISSTPRQPYGQESAATGVELLVQQSRAKQAFKPLFHCTFGGCSFSTHSSSDWKRHEEGEKHWPQKRSMCLECPAPQTDLQGNLICEFCSVPFFGGGANARAHYLQCMAARENGRTFARQDHLIQHLREKHGQVNIIQVAAAGEFGVISSWPRQCGFCGQFFESWSHRMEHIGQHYKEGANISSWKLPFPRSKGFHPSGSAPRRKDEDDDSSDDDFDGNNGPWLRKTSAHSSHKHKSSGIRTSNGNPSSSQSSNSRSQPTSQRCATNLDQTLQTRLLLSVDTSSMPTFNANSVRGVGSLRGSLENPILAAFVDRRWGDRASSAEHSRLGDNLENNEAKPATSEASLEADIFALDPDYGRQVAAIPSREALFELELQEKFRKPPSFCDANNDNNIDDDNEKFLGNGPTKLQTTADAIPWTAGTEGLWWSNSEEGTLAPPPGLAYTEYYSLSRKYTTGHKKIQRKQKLLVDPRPNDWTSLTLQRYLNDTEDLFLGRGDTGSDRTIFTEFVQTAADQVFSSVTKRKSLSSKSHLVEFESELRRRPSWRDCFMVAKIFLKDSPLAVQARDFIFKHRNILTDGIFWMHSNIDPGLKDSFLDITIRLIEPPGMKPLPVIRFFHIWSRSFCESLSGRSRCIGELVSSPSNSKLNDQNQTLSILYRSLNQALQGCSKKYSSDCCEKSSPDIAQPQPPTNTDPFTSWKFSTTTTIHRAHVRSIQWQCQSQTRLCAGKAPTPQNLVPVWDQRLDKFGRAISSLHCRPLDIRILSLQSAQEKQANIVCTLILNDSPRYHALSYIWGDSEDLGRVSIEPNGFPTSNSASIYNALRCLQHLSHCLWIDALCISQGDASERNRQVSMMSDIYKSASNTVIWLESENQRFPSSTAADWRIGWPRRGPWPTGEGFYLNHLVRNLEASTWVRISQLLGSRSLKQCREGYNQKLKLSTNHDPISSEEGLQIERIVWEIWKRWAAIAESLQGRSDNAVKNWYHLTLARRQRLLCSPRSPPQDPRNAGDFPRCGEEIRKPLPFLRFRGYVESSSTTVEGPLDLEAQEALRDNSLPGIPGRIDEGIGRTFINPNVFPEVWTRGDSNRRFQIPSQYFGESSNEVQSCTSS